MLKPRRGYASGTILAFLMSFITAPQALGCSHVLPNFYFWLKMPLPMLFHEDALPLKLAISYFNEVLLTLMDG